MPAVHEEVAEQELCLIVKRIEKVDDIKVRR